MTSITAMAQYPSKEQDNTCSNTSKCWKCIEYKKQCKDCNLCN